MRKSTLLKAVAVAVLPMLALSACGSTSDTNADAKGGEQTVTFWYSNSGPAVDAINQLVSEFNDAHKGKIKVEASYQAPILTCSRSSPPPSRPSPPRRSCR